MPNKIFYDTVPIIGFTESDKLRHQFIIFAMDRQLMHIPFLSFCFEDVMEKPGVETAELYIPDIDINVENGLLKIILGDKADIVECDGTKLTSSTAQMVKTKFNNYQYIERTVIDQHTTAINALIQEVQRIVESLSEE